LVRTLDSPRHEALRAFLVERRDKAGLSQTGQKLVDVVEMMEWAEAIGFDAGEIIKRLARVPRK
jgi:hypothetical protein